MLSRSPLKTFRQFTNFSSNLTRQTFNDNLNVWMKKYEDFVGLTEVKAAQNRVLEAETKFVKSQEERRETQRKIGIIQQKLQDLHAELDRVPRGDDKYLALITQEHAVIKDDKRLREEFQHCEKEERENFAALSHAVRDSHEKERAQAEKTKYWSIIGSVLGTILGILGTSINNRLRMKELRELVQDAAHTKQFVDISADDLISKITSVISRSKEEVTAQSHSFHESDWKTLIATVKDITENLKRNQEIYLHQNQKLEALMITDRIAADQEKHFVIPENELKSLLDNQRQDISRLVLISSIFIPVTAWALSKFVNL